MGNTLISAAFKVIGKSVRKKIAPTYARTIVQKGNGERRAIISGFSGPNLDEGHFKLLNFYKNMNYRPVIAGYTGKKGMARLSALPGRGFLRFFPMLKNPRMSRHVVYDVQTQRKAIKGFSFNTNQEIVKIGPAQTSQTIQKPQIATERVVVQGYTKNSTEPVMKKVEPSSQRVVVKGFTA